MRVYNTTRFRRWQKIYIVSCIYMKRSWQFDFESLGLSSAMTPRSPFLLCSVSLLSSFNSFRRSIDTTNTKFAYQAPFMHKLYLHSLFIVKLKTYPQSTLTTTQCDKVWDPEISNYSGPHENSTSEDEYILYSGNAVAPTEIVNA